MPSSLDPDTPESQIRKSGDEDDIENSRTVKPNKGEPQPDVQVSLVVEEPTSTPNSISNFETGSWIGSPAGLRYTLSPASSLTPVEQDIYDHMRRPYRRHKPTHEGSCAN